MDEAPLLRDCSAAGDELLRGVLALFYQRLSNLGPMVRTILVGPKGALIDLHDFISCKSELEYLLS